MGKGEAGSLGWSLPITGSSSSQCDCGNQGRGCLMQNSQTGCLLKLQLPGPLPSPDVSYPLRVGPETSVFLANSLGDSVAASPVPIFRDHRFKPAMVIIRKLRSREGI